ncbi:hypothetical protein KA005_58870 [bacterium]|nr:hypothetical protein [bacterium]
MSEIEKDEEREYRISAEVIVDAYGLKSKPWVSTITWKKVVNLTHQKAKRSY